MWGIGNAFAPLAGIQIGADTVESSMEFPQKLKMKLPYDTAIPFLEIYPKESETLV